MMRGIDLRITQQRISGVIRSPVCWVLFGTFAIEFLLFDRFGARRHAAVFPRWHDQIQYLGESYAGFEFVRSHGVIAGLLNALTNPGGQGSLHDFFALIIFLVAGPSRSSALAVNMLAM